MPTLYTSICRFDDDMLVNPHVTKYADCFDRVGATAEPAWKAET